MFDFSIVTNWIHELLLSIMPEGLAIFIECVAVGVCLVALYAILAIILIYMERKVCGFFQCRLGPNRVGKWGSIQVVCDVLKMLTKEIFMPKLDLQKKCDSAEISTKALDLRGMLDALRLIRRGIPAGAALDMGITNKAFDSYEQSLIRDVIAARIPAKLDAAKLFG